MKIKINYTLYTDGDYNLKNAEEFGCVTNRHEYNYIGFMEFKDKEAWRCKHKAKSFLWRFLCDGIHVSYTHPWLLKDFYDIIESLENAINKHQNGLFVTKRYITGNYDGTEIKIEIS